jgi:enterochelin esterase-like enzyme
MRPDRWPPRARPPAGRVVRLPVESDLLRGNALGDPHARTLPVWLPPGYDDSSRRYPVVHYLVGFTGGGESKVGWKPWAESMPQRLERLLAAGRIEPMIVAFPDCFTRLGGSQYIDSSVCGPYARHLTEELVPLVDRLLRTRADRRHRAVAGKSSGGFGAMIHGMLHADTWGAVACHSGDAGFELCFRGHLGRTLDEVGRWGSVAAFLDQFEDKKKRSTAEVHAVMHLAMAACFDPQPAHPDGFELPLELHSGRLIPERWANWLKWDPVRLIPEHAAALRRLRLLFIDCGNRDQYQLHYGARQMVAQLKAAGVPHEYEEFSDNHSSVDYRLDVSLPRLSRALQ